MATGPRKLWPAGWAAQDGLLVVDLDGSGQIEDGTEVISPWFCAGDYFNSLEALGSFDSDGNGLLDTADQAFFDIQVWRDANGNGITEHGELGSLNDHGILAISLDADHVDYDLNGTRLFAQGRFAYETGDSSAYAEVAFAPQPQAPELDIFFW